MYLNLNIYLNQPCCILPMKVVFPFLLLLLLLPACLQAQEFPGLQDEIIDSASHVPVHRYQSIGLSYRTTRDEALSPLRFDGPGISFASSRWKYNEGWLWQSAFGAGGSLLSNEPASSVLSEAAFRYSLTPLKSVELGQDNRWGFWLGPEAGMLLHLRMHSRNTNNIAAYDWAAHMGVSGMLTFKFKLWNRPFALGNQLQLPLLFVYARPPFAWGIPPGIYEEQEGAWKEAFAFGALNHIFSVGNQLYFDFYLGKRKNSRLVRYRAYRLSYSWNYFQVNTINTVQTGGHRLSLSRALSF